MKQGSLGRLAAALLAAALLAGCSLTAAPVNVDELLRAPQRSGAYSAVQTALNSYLGESAQLKYPNTGDFLSPFLFGDWNGDGVQDAAVLYTSSVSANVQLAVLQTDAEGVWQVCGVAEGLSDTVDSVRFATMQSEKAAQIVVGYATAGDTYLAVYSDTGGGLQIILQQPYTQYLVEDITGSGTEDLVVLSTGETGQTQVQVLTGSAEGFSVMQQIGLPAEQFSGYASLVAGQGAHGGNYLVLDGWTGANGNYLASRILRYDAATGQMAAAALLGSSDIYADSLRYAACLTSRDLDGDGVVEIPTQAEEAGSLNLTQSKRYAFVQWMDFTSATPEQSFGIVDEEYGYYLELPRQWKGNLMLTDGADGTVELYNLSGEQQYLSLRVVERGTASQNGWQTVATIATRQVQARLSVTDGSLTSYQLVHSFYLLD